MSLGSHEQGSHAAENQGKSNPRPPCHLRHPSPSSRDIRVETTQESNSRWVDNRLWRPTW